MVEPVIAVLAGVVAVLAPVTVLARNPITSAFSLVSLMVVLAGIYAVIGVHFVAALQAIVYAGAVMVLFVFSIMLLNMNEEKSELQLRSMRTYASIAAVGAVFFMLVFAFLNWSQQEQVPKPDVWTLERVREAGGNALVISASLFSKAYIQFEIISLLLLVAIAGALVLAKRKVD